jgi:hypothetical protein
MSNQFKNKIVGNGTTPMSLNGVPFYIRMDVTPMRNEVRSSQTQMFEDKKLVKTNVDKDIVEVKLLAKICEDQDWLIREQDTHIRELQNRIADYEQELYEKDQMLKLDAELEQRSNSIEEAHRGGYQ